MEALELKIDVETILCKTCGNPFTPLRGYSGIIQSRVCGDCRYKEALDKRRALICSPVKSPNLPVKSVVKDYLTTEKATKKSSAKLESKDVDELLVILTRVFNLFIRNRDRLPNDYFYCPTCDKTKKIVKDNYQACHVFPSTYSALRYLEINVHGGCKSCNYYHHGAGHEYNDWLRKKIGEVEYQKLLDLKDYWKAHQWKWDRFSIIRMIEVYKARNKVFIKP